MPALAIPCINSNSYLLMFVIVIFHGFIIGEVFIATSDIRSI
jgi:hypothetical protein